MVRQQSPLDESVSASRSGVLFGVVLAVLVFSEWLFQVTKPSFFDALRTLEKLEVLLAAALLPALAATLPTCLLLAALQRGLRLIPGGKFLTQLLAHGVLFLAAIFAAMGLLLLTDNFTYTVFGWGVITSVGSQRDLYGLYFCLLILPAYLALAAAYRRPWHGFPNIRAAAILALVALLGWIGQRTIEPAMLVTGGATGHKLPNIVIFSGDGIRAENMSLYGYSRQTTPFLEEFSRQCLVATRSYTNARDSGGSVISMLTGRYPTATGVVYPPDALRGGDAYRHLPGVLHRAGYHTADVSIRHYVDAFDMNLRGGFDHANGRQIAKRSFGLDLLSAPNVSLFLTLSLDRMVARYQHIYWIKDIEDLFSQVTQSSFGRWPRDDARINEVVDLLADAQSPFFINVHLMGTHGPTFRPRAPHFSRDMQSTYGEHMDFYDDAIRDFDTAVRKIVGVLRDRSELEQTILVISSDHGLRHSAMEPVPLMFCFPGGAYQGIADLPTQRLDIAPTLLDALGMEIPGWMDGASLLTGTLTTERPIIYVGSSPKELQGRLYYARQASPYFSLFELGLVTPQGAYVLNLESGKLKPQFPSNPDQLKRANDLLMGHLQEHGYPPPEVSP